MAPGRRRAPRSGARPARGPCTSRGWCTRASSVPPAARGPPAAGPAPAARGRGSSGLDRVGRGVEAALVDHRGRGCAVVGRGEGELRRRGRRPLGSAGATGVGAPTSTVAGGSVSSAMTGTLPDSWHSSPEHSVTSPLPVARFMAPSMSGGARLVCVHGSPGTSGFSPIVMPKPALLWRVVVDQLVAAVGDRDAVLARSGWSCSPRCGHRRAARRRRRTRHSRPRCRTRPYGSRCCRAPGC